MKSSYELFIISLLIMLPRAISETLFRLTAFKIIWVFRIIDVFDLILQTISYFALILYVYSRYIWKASKKYHIIFLVLSSFLIGGHMMHSATNAIDMHFREVLELNPEDVMPASAYTLLHFYDEYLSHAIIYMALIFIISMGALLEIYGNQEQVELNLKDKILIALIAIILGIALGISAVESSIPIFVAVLTFTSIIIIIYYVKKKLKYLGERPFTFYTIILFITIIISDLGYYLIFGMTSPRELILGNLLGG